MHWKLRLWSLSFNNHFVVLQIQKNRKYAKWKAAYIHKCLKNGETPEPGPLGGEDGEGLFIFKWRTSKSGFFDRSREGFYYFSKLGESQNQLCFGGENEEEFFGIERLFWQRKWRIFFFLKKCLLSQVFFGRESEEYIFFRMDRLRSQVFLAKKMKKLWFLEWTGS